MSNEPTSLPGIPLKDLDGPAFDQPWQAQAFSLVVSLHQAGLFEWKDWAEAFTSEIAASPAVPGESVNDTYFRQWVSALEKFAARLKLTCGTDIDNRARAWRQAYLNTPHGQPIMLANADCPPPAAGQGHHDDDDHHHHHHQHVPKRSPVAVVPAAS